MDEQLLRPTRLEYDLGGNDHGQPVKLVRYNGKWTLHREAANQRDDAAMIDLTDTQLKMLGGIVERRDG